MALDVKVLDSDGNEVILKENIDDDGEDLQINIDRAEDAPEMYQTDAPEEDSDDLLDDELFYEFEDTTDDVSDDDDYSDLDSDDIEF